MDKTVSSDEPAFPLVQSGDKAAEGGAWFVDDIVIGRSGGKYTSVTFQAQLIGNNKDNTFVLYFV